MAEAVKMPKMSDTMDEGVLAKWHKKVGDKVESGDVLAEVETDKATMDLESFQEGTLLYIGVEEGDAVPVDAVIAVLGEEGEDYKSLLKESPDDRAKKEEKKEEKEEKEEPEEEAEKEEEKAEEEAESGKETLPAGRQEAESEEVEEPGKKEEEDTDRIKASPLAKKIAEERGIDLAEVKGSGDGGRIVKRDVEAYGPTEAAPAAAAPEEEAAPAIAPVASGKESYDEVKVSQMRKTIARRLSESKFSAPHYYLTVSINMDKAIETRTKLNELSPVKLSFNDLVIKAAAAALRQHPKVNAEWLEDKIRYNHHINIGVAVAVEEGLLVPVVRYADAKSLSQIASEVKVYAQKAKDKKLQPSEWEGSTFTISNLGMFGIEEFTAIINPPASCIMAVGGIRQVPVVADGAIKIGNEMKVTLSCDHRVVDGATGAGFLQTFKSVLEDPLRILV